MRERYRQRPAPPETLHAVRCMQDSHRVCRQRQNETDPGVCDAIARPATESYLGLGQCGSSWLTFRRYSGFPDVARRPLDQATTATSAEKPAHGCSCRVA